jgi:hypothetical protein
MQVSERMQKKIKVAKRWQRGGEPRSSSKPGKRHYYFDTDVRQ